MSYERLVVRSFENKPQLHAEKSVLVQRNVAYDKHLATTIPGAVYGGLVSVNDLDRSDYRTSPNTLWSPSDSLTMEQALRLGAITEEHAKLAQNHAITPEIAYELWHRHPEQGPRLVGAVVPPLIESKVSIHRLINGTSTHPSEWESSGADELSESLKDLTIYGYSGFAWKDLRSAVKKIIRRDKGFARLKPGKESGGTGQYVVSNETFDAAATKIQNDFAVQSLSLESVGVGAETQLDNPHAFSIGQLYLNGKLISYIGVLRQVEINGSKIILETDRFIVEGPYENLFNRIALPARARNMLYRSMEYQAELAKTKELIFLRSSINWLEGNVETHQISNPRFYSAGTEHTLRKGYSTVGEQEGLAVVGEFPVYTSVRQTIEHEGNLIKTEHTPMQGETTVFSFQNNESSPQVRTDGRQPLPITREVSATLHTDMQSVYEDEYEVATMLYGRREKIIYQMAG